MATAPKFTSIPGMNPKFDTGPSGTESAFMALAAGIKGYQARREEEKGRQAQMAASILPSLASRGQLEQTTPGEGIYGSGFNVGQGQPDYMKMKQERDYKVATGAAEPGPKEIWDMENKVYNKYTGNPAERIEVIKGMRDNPSLYTDYVEQNKTLAKREVAEYVEALGLQTGRIPAKKPDINPELPAKDALYEQLKGKKPQEVEKALRNKINSGELSEKEASALWKKLGEGYK